MTEHEITVRNWNDNRFTFKFTTTAKTYDAIVGAAHRAARKAGFTTYELLDLDGTAMPYELAYK